MIIIILNDFVTFAFLKLGQILTLKENIWQKQIYLMHITQRGYSITLII